jgi:hypothetical protein
MEEATPFLPKDAFTESKWLFIVPCILVQLFSVLRFFLHPVLDRFLVLTESDFYFVAPFVFNIFVEDDGFMYVINSLLLLLFVSLLLKYWKFNAVFTFVLLVASISNAVIWLLFYIASFLVKSFVFSVSGSLSTIVALSIALVYAGRSDSQSFIGISVVASQLFWGLGVWVIFCVRWLPSATFSGILSAPLACFLLVKYQGFFGFPRNEDFSVQQLFQASPRVPEKSILDSLGLPENPDLSEADQNRRMRALRAIEERLESLQSSK